MLIKNGLVFNSETLKFEKKNIQIEHGVVVSFNAAEDGDVIDVCGARIIPGLCDVHTHGRAGYDFISSSEEGLHAMARAYARAGVTTVMPTLASASFDDMLAAAERINNFVPDEGEANFVGVHIEGRYLNPKRKGAHAEELLFPLDKNELEASVFRMCRSLHFSAALELDDGSFCEKAMSIGATLGIGHTDADCAAAKRAEGWGATSYTHLFNCMPPLHHREGGAVCAALIGDAYVEIICDGIHISPDVIKLVNKCKDKDKISLISDSMEATGCADGDYSIAGNRVTVSGGIARTESGALAGSTLSLFDAIKNYMSFCGATLEEAVACASLNPARQMRFDDRFGRISVGCSADFIVLSDSADVSVDKIFVRGVQI